MTAVRPDVYDALTRVASAARTGPRICRVYRRDRSRNARIGATRMTGH